MPSVTPKHIVAIPSWYGDGRGSGGGYFRDQALALQAAGHRVAILAPDIHTWRDVRAGQVAAATVGKIAIADDGVPVYRHMRRVLMPRLPYRNAISWSLSGLALFRAYLAAHGKPDLVHAQSCLNAGVLAALIRARHGVPFVLTEHSTGFAQGRLRWWERDLVRRVIRRAQACVAVSPHLAQLLGAQYPGSSWTYVPNVLGEAFLAPVARLSRPREAAGGFIFICAARLFPVKNHALLIDAFADAFAGETQTRLLLAGDGPLEAELHAQCAGRGVESQVEFLGNLSSAALRGAMTRADAFVLASDIETFGVVVIEGLAAGLPVVCTASGGPEHLIDASNGLLVPSGDRAALRGALMAMRRNAANYDRGRISAETIVRFGPEAFARQFAALAFQRSPPSVQTLSCPPSPFPLPPAGGEG